jgi:hypothetical protein
MSVSSASHVAGVSVASFLSKNSSLTNVGLLNIRSLVKHSEELRVLLRGGGFSLFAVSETWMKSSPTLRSVSIPGYNFFYNNRPKFRGGGVGIFIRKEYRASLIIKSTFEGPDPQLEYLLVKVSFYNKEILVIVFTVHLTPISPKQLKL